MLEYGSISKTEKALGYGKDTLRKKLNRSGYTFNKNTKQYELLESKIGLKIQEKKKIQGSISEKCYNAGSYR